MVVAAILLIANYRKYVGTGRCFIVWERFWDVLEKVSDVLALFSVPAIFGGCYAYARDRMTTRRRYRALLDATHSSSAVLVVTVGQDSIADAVRKYIDTDAPIREALGITSASELTKDQFIEVELKERIKFPVPARRNLSLRCLERMLDRADKQMKTMGVKRIYLFYCGITIVAAKVGAQLSNRYKVLIYQYAPDTEQKYHYAGYTE